MSKTPKQAVEHLLAGIPQGDRPNYPTVEAMLEVLEDVVGKNAELLSLEESAGYFQSPEALVAVGRGEMSRREAGAFIVDHLIATGQLAVRRAGKVALVSAASLKEVAGLLRPADTSGSFEWALGQLRDNQHRLFAYRGSDSEEGERCRVWVFTTDDKLLLGGVDRTTIEDMLAKDWKIGHYPSPVKK